MAYTSPKPACLPLHSEFFVHFYLAWRADFVDVVVQMRPRAPPLQGVGCVTLPSAQRSPPRQFDLTKKGRRK